MTVPSNCDQIDNDGDGKYDMDDPECTTPCDDSEGSFLTDLPGQNQDCKNDCYWDSDSGTGNDKCEYDMQCDPQNPGAQINCEFDTECPADIPQQCLDVCGPLIPNGCDCFGCCEVPNSGDPPQYIFLGGSSECSFDNLDGCTSCTFQEECANECVPEECELCFGQDPDDLPEDCNEPECPDGVTSCLDTEDCPDGFFCLAGCCFSPE